MTEIEFVNLKNPAWHIGDVYWTERPDHHFYQVVKYEWKHRSIWFRGTAVVYLPADMPAASLIEALRSLGNGYEYRLISNNFLSPIQVREYVETAEACYR